MIKRILELSQDAAHLSVKNKQLRVHLYKKGDGNVLSFPCEDLGLVCIDHPGTTYTHGALNELVDNGVAIVICGSNHMPIGQMLPMSNNTEVVNRITLQINASKSTRKRLWQQLVRAKITAQAHNLESKSDRQRLLRMAADVRSGDPSNLEAQAARFYWSNFFETGQSFKRIAGARDPLNSMLNYGYAIIRAAVARALVIGGFYPAIGLHHKNRSNAFCLADDFMEPLRPMVDSTARRLILDGHDELNPTVKAGLLTLLTSPVRTLKNTGPLMVALHTVTASFKRCLEGEEKHLTLPVSMRR